MANVSDSTNIIQRNNSHESPISPTASIEFIRYEPMPSHPPSQQQQQRVPPNPMETMRGNEFREILNTAVQATQSDRQMQRQSEVLGKYCYIFSFCTLLSVASNSSFVDV